MKAAVQGQNSDNAPMNDRLQGRAAVCIRGLTKCYPDNTLANKGIDLDVYEGEVLSILGPDGAGKTTLVRQITAELQPTSGSIKITKKRSFSPIASVYYKEENLNGSGPSRISIVPCPKHIVWSITAQAKASLQARLWKP